jgi:hypothetical protein
MVTSYRILLNIRKQLNKLNVKLKVKGTLITPYAYKSFEDKSSALENANRK